MLFSRRMIINFSLFFSAHVTEHAQKLREGLIRSSIALALCIKKMNDFAGKEDCHFFTAPIVADGPQAHKISVFCAELYQRWWRNVRLACGFHVARPYSQVA